MNPRTGPVIAVIAWAGGVVFVTSLGVFLYVYFVVFGRPARPGPLLPPLAADVALFTMFAMHHSLFARSGAKAWVRRVAPPVLERSIYTWIASVLFIAVCLLWQPVPGVLYHLAGPWAWAGFAIQAAGIVLTYFGARALDVMDLAGLRPMLAERRGGGLITSGAFGLVRHPLYFGWVLLVFGAPVMTGTRALFAAVSTLYVALAIPWEERSLVETFGRAYEEYRGRVRWRMLPGIY
jgi:protein-S-isoprenylcysteine O-methyltransferase Ste14